MLIIVGTALKIKETDLKSRATKLMIFNKDKNCIGFECKGDRPVFMDETKKLVGV